MLAVDVDVLANHLDQLFLQLGQIVRLIGATTFVGDNDLQAFFGNAGTAWLVAGTEKIDDAHCRALASEHAFEEAFFLDIQETVRNVFAQQAFDSVAIGLASVAFLV